MSNKIIPPEPGLRVRYLRERLKLTRQELVNLTGISANTLRHIGTGAMELLPTKARSLAILFIYFFRLPEEEANEHFLLYGKKKMTLTRKDPDINQALANKPDNRKSYSAPGL